MPELCAAPGCGKPARKNRFNACSMHEARMRRGGSFERRQEKMTLHQILGGKMLFGLWQVLSEGEPYIRGNGESMRRAMCRCACGVERLVPIHTLKQGNSKHCGCRQHIFNEANHLRHGDTRRSHYAAEYGIWSKMIGRCTSPNDKHFRHYGGRGISVCDRWRLDYVNFLADMGRRPSPKHSIDRIDVNGNYEPGNCRWATAREQAANKQNTHWVQFRGERVALIEACRRAGVECRYKLIHKRVHSKGMTFDQALAMEGITP